MLSRLYQGTISTCRRLSLSTASRIIFKADREPLKLPDGSFTNYLMSRIYEHYSKNPKKLAIIDVSRPDQKLTYGDVYLHTLSVSSYLKSINFKHGDVAGIILSNNVHYPSIAFGITLNGGAATTISYAFSDREITLQMNDSKPKVVFTLNSLLGTVSKAVEACPFVEKIIVLNDNNGEIVESDKIVDFEKVKNYTPDVHNNDVEIIPKKDLFALPYSSGTTGPPKGVMLSHHGIKSAIFNFTDILNNRCLKQLDPPYDFDNAVQFIFLPMYHMYGLALMLSAFKEGTTITTMPKIDMEIFCKTIQDYKIRDLKVVPPLMVFFAKHPMVDKYDLSSLEFIICGAAPLREDTVKQVKKRLPNVKYVMQGYGMTEVTLCSVLPDLKDGETHSAGRLIPGFEMKIMDPETNKELGYNEAGELWFKTEQSMLGYLNKPYSTGLTLDDEGWLHTGDIGYMDEAGQLHIVERLKELIKVSGYQVPPAEMEALLLEHPNIRDVAVIAVPDEEKGEVPRAFVVKNGEVTEENIKEYVANNAAPYKKLRGGVVFVDEIPKSPSGKILRRLLKSKLE